MSIHYTLVFLHVLAISAWIGATLWIAGDVRRTVERGKPFVDALPARVGPAFSLDAVAGIATFVTGALLIWEEQVGRPRFGIIAGIVLTFVRGGLLGALKKSWREILGRIQAGQAVPANEPAAKRMSMLSGIAHLTWLLALAGMVFPV